jgi:hypothetical protein
MVPPWVPKPPLEEPPADKDAAPPEGDDVAEVAPDVSTPAPIAPAGRFRAARQSLGSFAQSGSDREMRRGVGHYVRTGYGGAATASRRFSGTAVTATSLYNTLSRIAAGGSGSPIDRELLAGRSAKELMDVIVEAVRPVDGTQDAEAARPAIRDALSELLTQFPEADLLKLNAKERDFAVERYTAIDVFRRFQLDVGKTIQESAPTATTALSRLKQIRNYIKETVAASFRKLRSAGNAVTTGRVGQVVRDALRDALKVFEDYTE